MTHSRAQQLMQSIACCMSALLLFAAPAAARTAGDLFPAADRNTHVLILHTSLDNATGDGDMPVIDALVLQRGYTKAPTNLWSADAAGYTAEILAADGQVLYRTGFTYNRVITVPLLPEQWDEPTGEPDVPLERPEASLVLPYFPGAALVHISAPGGSPVAEIDINDAASSDNFAPSDQIAAAPAEQGKFHLLIMASGFSAGQMASFTTRAQAIESQLDATAPFSTYAADIDVHIYANTADLGCSPGCSGIDRLMCCTTASVTAAAAASGYYYDEIIVIHNTSTYAGGGYRDLGNYRTNSYSTYCAVYAGAYTTPMAVHEFGHSFGDLCDEYSYSGESSSYYDCVNCRASCGDWSDITGTCIQGCSARSNYYRPEPSIMLDLGYDTFNQVSIDNSLKPRLQYFTIGTPIKSKPFLSAADMNGDAQTDLVYIDVAGNVYYTTNLSSWTRVGDRALLRTAGADLDGGGLENDLAGINANNYILYTTDLDSWTKIGSNRFSTLAAADLSASGRNKDLAAINMNNYLLYTTDLSNWQKIGSNKFSQLLSADLSASGRRKDIVGLNLNRYAMYSTDLSSWAKIGANKFSSVVTAGLNDTDADSSLAGITLNRYILYSDDLSNWQKIGSNKFSRVVAFDHDGNGIKDDLAGLNLNSYILYTTDRDAWTKIGANKFNTIVAGDFDGDGAEDDLAGVALSDHVLYTTDTRSWTRITKP